MMKGNTVELVAEIQRDRTETQKLTDLFFELSKKVERYNNVIKSGKNDDILIAAAELNSVNYDILQILEALQLHRSACERLLKEVAKDIVNEKQL